MRFKIVLFLEDPPSQPGKGQRHYGWREWGGLFPHNSDRGKKNAADQGAECPRMRRGWEFSTLRKPVTFD